MGSSGYIVRLRVELSSVESVGFAAVIDKRARSTVTKVNSRSVKGNTKRQTRQPCSVCKPPTERRERKTEQEPKSRRDVSCCSTPDALFDGAR